MCHADVTLVIGALGTSIKTSSNGRSTGISPRHYRKHPGVSLVGCYISKPQLGAEM